MLESYVVISKKNGTFQQYEVMDFCLFEDYDGIIYKGRLKEQNVCNLA
jgi:hypothetical protein